MKQKKILYLALLLLGFCFLLAAWFLPTSDSMGGMLTGMGSGLLALGISRLLLLRQQAKHPEQYRQNEIAANDERNVAIRRRAQAISGEVLQWGILAAAWFSIGLDAPLWVTLLATGLFLAKSLLELYLMIRYEREM
ncbi:MAG: hypothetical protein HFG08_02510 [Oscillibacter sp.]|nr:hypothetical protein [Oscillibacter sp.]